MSEIMRSVRFEGRDIKSHFSHGKHILDLLAPDVTSTREDPGVPASGSLRRIATRTKFIIRGSTTNEELQTLIPSSAIRKHEREWVGYKAAGE